MAVMWSKLLVATHDSSQAGSLRHFHDAGVEVDRLK